MREKPTCNICHSKFTRKWNMKKHMQNIHNVFESEMKKVPAFASKNRVARHTFEIDAGQVQSPTTGLDRSLEWLSNLIRISFDYAKSMNLYQENINDKGKIAMLQNEANWIKSNNWIVPNSQVQGLSGYVCRRCNQIAFLNIRDIGYDMTMREKHRCDEEKVKSIPMCSIRPSDIEHLNDFVASNILERLNCIMPGQKYLLGVDMSSSFNSLERMLNTETAKLLLGIPDRYYYYSVAKGERITWLDKAVSNVGRKTMVEEFEIRDLLRKVKSTYAIFEIPIGHNLRRFLLRITT